MPHKKNVTTSVLINIPHRDLLKKLAQKTRRTMQGQLEVLIDKEAKKEGIE
jgi:hypothetical protein